MPGAQRHQEYDFRLLIILKIQKIKLGVPNIVLNASEWMGRLSADRDLWGYEKRAENALDVDVHIAGRLREHSEHIPAFPQVSPAPISGGAVLPGRSFDIPQPAARSFPSSDSEFCKYELGSPAGPNGPEYPRYAVRIPCHLVARGILQHGIADAGVSRSVAARDRSWVHSH